MSATGEPIRPDRARAAVAWGAGIGTVVGVDQVTKVTSSHLAPVPGVTPLRNPASGLELVDAGRWVGSALMLLGVALAAGWLLPRAHGRRAVLAATLLLGGATGNLMDRLVLGYVRDFLVIGPVVVNLADLAVVLGLCLWLLRPKGTSTGTTPTGRRGRLENPAHRPGTAQLTAPTPMTSRRDLSTAMEGGEHSC